MSNVVTFRKRCLGCIPLHQSATVSCNHWQEFLQAPWNVSQRSRRYVRRSRQSVSTLPPSPCRVSPCIFNRHRLSRFGTYGLTRESTADLCSNPQLKLLPCAYAQSQRVLYASPRRLHSDTNIVVTVMSSRSSCDQRGPGDLGLEFFVGSLTLNEDGMVTAIDKPTDGMRKHLRENFGQMGVSRHSSALLASTSNHAHVHPPD
ncbi:hypothetical protein ARMSODRAFT_680028 [Armillaria solidipes]|uniref:Uncharacterized protein n=1 Tax=Armillaria solidipes TaxID=1076256 RepID=A0A2H3APX9_9AGAR|nr:hypothetical protein ARMSODRAFT_680028 [Armillaria solidipes]